MVSDREAFVADRIRKVCTVLLAAAGTWFLFRVLFRLAHGKQRLLDFDLAMVVLFTALTFVWIRATRRVPRRRLDSKQAGSDE